MMDSKYIVVTGANSGIGYAITKYLSERGYNIIGTARKKSDLDRLDSMFNVISHYLDVTQSDSIDTFSQFLESSNIKIFGLINNAGIIIIGSIFLLDQKEIEKIFRTNVFGIINLTNALLPNLIKSKARIINISSDSGLTVYPSSTIYCMTKHALEAYSEGIRSELKPLGVKVSIIEPGNHKSNIIDNYLKNTESLVVPRFQEFEEQHNLVIDSARKWSNSSEARDPNFVSQSVFSCLNDDEPKLRYLVVSEEEHKYVINELLDKIAEINQTNQFSLTLDKLIDKLKFSFDTTNN